MAPRRWQTKDERRTEHALRLAAWQALSPKEQLAALDARGHRALKQRKRLEAKLNP